MGIAALSGIATMSKMVAGFIIIKAVALSGGSAAIAQIGQLQSIITLLTGLIAATAGTGLTKYVASPHSAEESIFYVSSSIKTSLGLLLPFIFILLIFPDEVSSQVIGNRSASGGLILLAIALPIYAVSILATAITNGKQEFRKCFIGTFFANLLGALAAILIIALFGSQGVVWGVLASGSVAAAFLTFYLRPSELWNHKVVKQVFSGASLKPYVPFFAMGVTAAVCGPLWQLNMRAVLSSELSWQSAGEWQALWRISEAYLTLVTTLISTYFFPRFAQDQNNDLGVVYRALWLVVPLCLGLSIVVYFFRDFIVALLYSSDLKSIEGYMALQFVGDLLKVICALLAYYLMAKKRVKEFILGELVYLLFVTLAAWLLIPRLGVSGAVWAYLCSCVLYIFYVLAVLYRHQKS